MNPGLATIAIRSSGGAGPAADARPFSRFDLDALADKTGDAALRTALTETAATSSILPSAVPAMPSIAQRDALCTLPKNRLVELAQGFELDQPTRSSKDDFVDALARSLRASFERILAALIRNELEVIFRAGDLDDGGKATAGFADRILRNRRPPLSPSSRGERAASPRTPGRPSSKPTRKAGA